jgi:hypothetical protein
MPSKAFSTVGRGDFLESLLRSLDGKSDFVLDKIYKIFFDATKHDALKNKSYIEEICKQMPNSGSLLLAADLVGDERYKDLAQLLEQDNEFAKNLKYFNPMVLAQMTLEAQNSSVKNIILQHVKARSIEDGKVFGGSLSFIQKLELKASPSSIARDPSLSFNDKNHSK